MQNKDLCTLILMLSHFNLASVSVSAGREGPEFVRLVCERFFYFLRDHCPMDTVFH